MVSVSASSKWLPFELMEKVDFIPDILHVHDYHTGMIPFLLKEKIPLIQAYQGIKTVFTIHNIEFQGQFDSGMLWEIFGVGCERYADGTFVGMTASTG